ncbi:FAD-binding protein [Microbacterium sp. W1N]|uniref:D-arabinono-1,4-lactone oxidase n=1 Tax=Microbacterium festucae TaxID=2977531 RepID=UPI0021BE0B1C|nr:D-arabinono-1,4-lactone oxidase [Microbacterium festucae]MCT9819759.1 FAD-binding protein [Microbacterium festucae]
MADMTSDVGTNWAGNLSYRASRLAEPQSLDALADLVRGAPRLRMLGSRHSFNDLADTDGVLVSLAALAGAQPSVAADRRTVRVPAGIRYGDLVPFLQAEGLALANLASLPHISVAGAVQTGTHGSGDAIGTLATQVAALELITGTGERLRLARGDADFAGAVVALGALGAVTHVELDVEPAYEVRQRVFEGARWDAVLPAYDEVTAAGDSVSLFTTWADPDVVGQVWVKSRTTRDEPDLAFVGAAPADGPRHPIPGVDPQPCTPQQGQPGAWFDRLPHFRLAFTPSVGAELQSEYLVARTDAAAAIEALRPLAGRIAPLLHVCEVRTMAADDLWLSPASGRPTVGIHFTWRPDEPAVRQLLPEIEAALPASARPHWGKISTLPADAVRARFPQWSRFAQLRERLDPQHRFGNAYLARLGL